MKVLDIPCKSTCFGDVEGITNLLKNGENDRQIMHKKEQLLRMQHPLGAKKNSLSLMK